MQWHNSEDGVSQIQDLTDDCNSILVGTRHKRDFQKAQVDGVCTHHSECDLLSRYCLFPDAFQRSTLSSAFSSIGASILKASDLRARMLISGASR